MTDQTKPYQGSGRRLNIDTQSQDEFQHLGGEGKVLDDELLVTSSFETVPEPELPKIERIYESPWRFGFKQCFFLALLVLIIVEAALTLIESYEQNILLFALYTTVLSLGLLALFKFLFSEAVALSKLKQHQQIKHDAQRLLQSDQIGEARAWLTPLLKVHPEQKVTAFEEALQSHHTDKEIITLYEKTLLREQDAEAKRLIQEHATTSALLVALSPLALVDMLAVLWRGVVLVEKVSKHYGIRLAYRSRITLYKMLLKQMVFVGASELVSDLAATSVGAELLGKLSTRSAQGLSAGIFTARLGYKAMELCRPLPRLEHKQSLLKSAISSVVDVLLRRSKKD
ncbi:TIGR01620 family protein [Pseudoalteromonas sp. McH1-7]|uniref:TIGR01620 family protein n=1 Tax=Pseudoalteromonas TaxID=53246 RepID=UPI0015919B6D|nr:MULTISPECIES: TIGR01620 family protein [Pseudoalteromonas]MDW7547910.1 TIGR01620 family protein [Pseudoalteromonas peptidolytica]NUZ11098.1 TIGR01620 family protein [Pseudoalteromonas sp. McH1-7]USD27490.1 TIGR01620 family protein [Pseudoalteromonas sp. SCSIO 43201]